MNDHFHIANAQRKLVIPSWRQGRVRFGRGLVRDGRFGLVWARFGTCDFIRKIRKNSLWLGLARFADKNFSNRAGTREPGNDRNSDREETNRLNRDFAAKPGSNDYGFAVRSIWEDKHARRLFSIICANNNMLFANANGIGIAHSFRGRTS
jgi:hypothetical protein